jgi:predicted Zn-dependent peptidase
MSAKREAAPFVRGTTSTGLRVVVAPQPTLHRSHVALYVHTGSRYETKKNNGISHFLEHMMYRGTPRLPSAHAVNRAFERLGGSLYAATQVDYGIFSVTLPSESLEEATRLFGEVISEPVFRDIAIEQGIVCEEILEDLDEDGRQIDADNLSRALIYPDHALGFTITGDAETVRSFDRQALADHHGRHYTAGSSVLAFGGAIEPARALDLAESAFGNMKRGSVVPRVAPVHTQDKPRFSYVESVSSQADLRVSFRAVGEHHPQKAAMDMAMRVIDDGMSTRLYKRICDEKGLCYDVSAGFDVYEDDGIVDFAAGVQHARAPEVTQEILELLVDLGTDGPTEDELEVARARQAWEFAAMNDTPDELAGHYAGGMLFDTFKTPEQRMADFAAIGRDEVREAVRLLARPECLNVVAVGLLERDVLKKMRATVRDFRGVR